MTKKVKISKENIEKIRNAIIAATDGKLPAYAEKIRKEYLGKYTSDDKRDPERRIRWDAFWCAIAQARAKKIPFTVEEIEGTIKDCHTSHIDTALKKIVPPLLSA
jgi:hypothetical protein